MKGDRFLSLLPYKMGYRCTLRYEAFVQVPYEVVQEPGRIKDGSCMLGPINMSILNLDIIRPCVGKRISTSPLYA
ncbi:hypothetical protein CCL15_12660 [Pseudomonas syringae]|nr:hypothetical protein CCL15_12660 [Pseudomonas syringae]